MFSITIIAARIKKNKKTDNVKFKVRCQRHLYTLVLKDGAKADKLKQSLPPSMRNPVEYHAPRLLPTRRARRIGELGVVNGFTDKIQTCRSPISMPRRTNLLDIDADVRSGNGSGWGLPGDGRGDENRGSTCTNGRLGIPCI